MAQFDAYANNEGDVDIYPFILDVQADLLSDLASRVVVPLGYVGQAKPMRGLNPVFTVMDSQVFMDTANLAAVDRRLLKTPICSFDNRRTDIINALDILFAGV